MWGFSPDDRGAWHVYFSERPTADFHFRDFPESLPRGQRFKGVRLLQPEIEPTVPAAGDVLVAQLVLTRQERESYAAFLDCKGCFTSLSEKCDCSYRGPS